MTPTFSSFQELREALTDQLPLPRNSHHVSITGEKEEKTMLGCSRNKDRLQVI